MGFDERACFCLLCARERARHRLRYFTDEFHHHSTQHNADYVTAAAAAAITVLFGVFWRGTGKRIQKPEHRSRKE